ncbi:MAG: sulfite exporter TauE/SafE family protein [Nitrospirae bacterium]|nr:sulfite exporter TauE/SafE family protein [Nitrospirota bacterium]
MDIIVLMAGLGLAAGFMSGLLGIGGGIVMAPLLLYTPQIFGFAPLSVKVVAGLTIMQGLVSCLSGMIAHRRFRFVSDSLAVLMGASIFIAALIGSAGSHFFSNRALLAVLAGLAFAAAVLVLKPVDDEGDSADASAVRYSRFRAVSVSAFVGLLGGLVGQGGSFILIPLMIAFVKIPTRIAIGSNLAIVFMSSLAGVIGKAATGQIEWHLAIPLAVAAMPAAQLGGMASRRVPAVYLRKSLAVVIAIAAARMGFSAIFP